MECPHIIDDAAVLEKMELEIIEAVNRALLANVCPPRAVWTLLVAAVNSARQTDWGYPEVRRLIDRMYADRN